MFKKIVSQLSFSPALVGQLGFYARRLRKEQFTRRLGMVFMASGFLHMGWGWIVVALIRAGIAFWAQDAVAKAENL